MKALAIFGNEATGSRGAALAIIDNKLQGSPYLCSEGGMADSITVNIAVTKAPHRVRCALYLDSDRSLVGVTEELLVPVQDLAQRVTFNFPAPKPSLVAGQIYRLVAWGDNPAGWAYPYQSYIPDQRLYHSGTVLYDGFPDPFTSTGWTLNVGMCIFCTYTPIVAVHATRMESRLIVGYDNDIPIIEPLTDIPVMLDGIPIGATPIDVTVDEGTHTLSWQREGDV